MTIDEAPAGGIVAVSPGVHKEPTEIEDTIKGCQAILNGECDDLSDSSLYMIGPIEEAFENEKRSDEGQAA